MDENVKVIMAYAIIAIGPIIGSYMVVKNSSKLTGALMGGFNKAGRSLSKAANRFAEKRYKRSAFGTYMADRDKTKDAWAKIRGRERIADLMKKNETRAKYESGLFKGRRTLGSRAGQLATVGMDTREARSFKAQLAGQDNAVYREEVESFKQKLGNEYSNKTTALPYFWDRMRAGDASAAEVHALHDHIASLPGGATELDSIWTGEAVDYKTGKNIGEYMLEDIHRTGGTEGARGAVRSLLADGSKFNGGSADVSYQLLNRSEDYIAAMAHKNPDGSYAGEEKAFLGVNSDYGTEATFHNAKGEEVTEKVIVPTDGNGGMSYWGERPKNAGGMGKRLGYELEASGKLTDEAAGLLFEDKQVASQKEHVMYEVAKRHLEKMATMPDGRLNPAENRNPRGASPTPTPPGGGSPPPPAPTSGAGTP